MDTISLIVLGVYTLIYVIVYFIQKSSIDNLKNSISGQSSVINSMKAYMDMFKIDEVRKYMDMKNERILDDASRMVTDDEKIQKIMFDTVKEKADEIKDLQMEKLEEQYEEMCGVISHLLVSLKKETADKLINEKLDSCKHIFQPIVDDYANKKT